MRLRRMNVVVDILENNVRVYVSAATEWTGLPVNCYAVCEHSSPLNAIGWKDGDNSSELFLLFKLARPFL
jgi:hypothetical protein